MKKRVLLIAVSVILVCFAAIAGSACTNHVCRWEERYHDETCETEGYWEKVCSVCGKTVKDASRITAALGHDMKETAEKAATCTSDGWSEHKACIRCDYKENYIVYLAAHLYADVPEKASTCTEDGYKAYKKCSACGLETEKTVIKAGHRMTTVQTKNAACCEDGYSEHLACKLCGYTEGKTVYPAAHDFISVEGKSATCIETGYGEYLSCRKCGAIKNFTVIPQAHEWIDKKDKSPSCTAAGWSAYRRCTVCGFEENKTLIPACHKYVYENGKEATCTEDGYTEYRVCTVCGDVAGKMEIAARHEFISIAGRSATCTTDGWSAYRRCTVCGFEENRNPIKASHYMVEINAAKASCYRSGHTAYLMCSVCGETEGKVIIPAKHDLYDVPGKTATCVSSGFTSYKACRQCTYTEGREFIKAQHNFETAEGKAATCTEDGYSSYKQCLTCGYVQGKDIIKAHHTMIFVEGMPANCTEDGYTPHRMCTVCGYTEGKTLISGGGHIYFNKPAKVPTCTEDGYSAYKECIKCGQIEGKTVLPAAHDMIIVPAKAPECTEDGWNEHTECSLCGISGNKIIILAPGHAMSEIAAKDKTCTEDGYTAHRACSVCGYTEGKTFLKALGHVPGEYALSKAATCDANAEESAVCSVCGETVMREIAGSRLEHEYEKNALLDQGSLLAYECKLCGNVEQRDPVRVIFLAGQSNAVGQSYSFHLQDKGSEITAAQYAEYKNGLDNAYIYYNNCEGIADEYKHTYSTDFTEVKFGQGVGVADTEKYPEGAFGPELGLAEYWREFYPGEKLYIIKYAYGGTNLYSRWRSPSSVADDAAGGEVGDLYIKTVNFARNGIRLLEQKGLAPQIDALVWMQGESDATHYFTYYERYAYFAEDMRNDLRDYSVKTGMAFIDGGISQYWPNYKKINSIKEDYSLSCSRNYYVDTVAAGLTYDRDNADYAHYDALSMLKLGRLFGEKLAQSAADSRPLSYGSAFYREGVVSDGFEGSGTEADPYLLETAADWALFGKNVTAGESYTGKYFKMTEDVYLSHHKFNPVGEGSFDYDAQGNKVSGGFYPGGAEKLFGGSLDGNGKTVHIRFYRNERNLALFRGLAAGGKICNLSVDGDIYVTDGTIWMAAGLVGYNAGIIENCRNYADITAYSRMAGIASRTAGIIENCYNYGELYCGSNDCRVGGIAGEATAGSLIKNCINNGSVTGGMYVGGIAGYSSDGGIDKCENTAKITGKTNVGGICARMTANYVSDCDNRGDIECTAALPAKNSDHQNIAGICGYADKNSSINRCNNYGSLTGKNMEYIVGGITGHLNMSSVSGCVNYGDITGSNQGINAAMRGYIGGIAGWAENSSSLSECTNLGKIENLFYRSGGVAGYLKNSVADGLTNGSAASATAGKIIVATGISNNRSRVGGVIGEVLSSTLGTDTAGIITNRNYGEILNMHVWSGGVVGYAESSKVYGCENSGSVSCVSGAFCVGGIIGYVKNVVTVKHCVNNADITAKYDVGGIVGYALDTTVIDGCINNGAAASSDAGKSGSISGNRLGKISNCTDNSGVN